MVTSSNNLKRNSTGSTGSDKNPTKKTKFGIAGTRKSKGSDIQCAAKSIAIQDSDKEAEPSDDAAFDADLANLPVEDEVTTLQDNEATTHDQDKAETLHRDSHGTGEHMETEAGTSDVSPPPKFRSDKELREAKQRRLKKKQDANQKAKDYKESRRVASILTGKLQFQATKDEDVFKTQNGEMECILKGTIAAFTGADEEATENMQSELTRLLA